MVSLYLAVAIVVATACLVISNASRHPVLPAARRASSLAFAAGILWPVLVCGFAQLGLVMLIRAVASGRPASQPEPNAFSAAGS